MPKELPAVPNLEHLKKQAKSLLSGFRGGNPEAVESFRLQGLPRATEEAKLADAQRVIAREYGFANWSLLKAHIDAITLEKGDPQGQLKRAVRQGDANRVAKLIERHPVLRKSINSPILGFDSPPILIAAQSGNRELVDVLLRFGANINARSQWWAGGFGVLDSADSELAAFLIGRGAAVDVHAAAHLGMLPRLKELIEGNRELVNARGGDGKTPLHCAASVEVAAYLLDQGADIDARDIDHESTTAQDRKSTRLNSCHPSISYAVFCLKKKSPTCSRRYKFQSPYTPHSTPRSQERLPGRRGWRDGRAESGCDPQRR